MVFEGPDRWLNPGDSVIVAPTGEVVAGPLHEEYGILYADIDATQASNEHRTLDVAGHYGRPDIFTLTVDRSPRPPIHIETTPVAGATGPPAGSDCRPSQGTVAAPRGEDRDCRGPPYDVHLCSDCVSTGADRGETLTAMTVEELASDPDDGARRPGRGWLVVAVVLVVGVGAWLAFRGPDSAGQALPTPSPSASSPSPRPTVQQRPGVADAEFRFGGECDPSRHRAPAAADASRS